MKEPHEMKSRHLALALAALSAAVVLAGCKFSLFGGGESGGKTRRISGSLDPYYDVYKGPLQVGRPYRTIRQNTFTEIGGDYDPAVSPDGQWLLFASTYHSRVPEIYMKTVDGATVQRLTSSPEAEIQPCFNRDGSKFAYASNRRGNWDIYIRKVSGGDLKVITQTMHSDEISPSFHPKLDWIAFSTYNQRSGRWEIGIRKTSGTGVTITVGEGLYPRFSPDGSKLAFQRARSRSPRWFSIWTVDVDKDMNIGNPTEVISSAKWAAINPSWSPDSKYIAFATVHESPIAQHTKRILNGDDIWVVNVEGRDLIRLTQDQAPDSHPFWARDEHGNERIYFCSMRKGPKNIWSLTPKLPDWNTVSGKAAATRAGTDAGRTGTLPTYVAPLPPVTAGGTTH
jgi:Tol biopolymer transport system component